MKALKLGICLLCLLPAALPAQQTPADGGEAAAAEVPGQELDRPGDDPAARAEEIDALEPGVSTELLAAEGRSGSRTGPVMDSLDLGTTEVTGNQELPKVMYIVPWRESDPGDLMGRPATSLLDDVLAPVDRSEFVREVDYYHDLFEAAEPE